MAIHRWEEMTWCALRDIPKERAVAILPIGATEAHGPHLPLGTDTIISTEMAARAARRLNEKGFQVLLLPPLCFTPAAFARSFPGTVSLSPGALLATLRDIADSIRKAGFRRYAIANSHLDPEHIAAVRQAAEEAGWIFPDKTRRRWAEKLTPEFLSGSCHAGRYETSLVLAARAELVGDRRLPELRVDLVTAIRKGVWDFAAVGMDQAYCGAPSEGTREEGDRVFDVLADMIVTTILEHCGASPG